MDDVKPADIPDPLRALDAFLKRADALGQTMGRKRGGISSLLFNDGAKLDELHGEGDIGVRRLKRAIADLKKLERRATAR